MPVIFVEQGDRFYFFSNEGNPREPVHVHVSKADIDAKLWLYPKVRFAYSDGCDARTRRWIVGIVEARKRDRGELE